MELKDHIGTDAEDCYNAIRQLFYEDKLAPVLTEFEQSAHAYFTRESRLQYLKKLLYDQCWLSRERIKPGVSVTDKLRAATKRADLRSPTRKVEPAFSKNPFVRDDNTSTLSPGCKFYS